MPILTPTSIAVIGASAEEQKVGYAIFHNLISQGFKGAVYPVNAKHDEVLGKKAYKSVTEIADAIDLAVIVTPAVTVPGVLEECGKKGIKQVIVISAGFGEVGTDAGKDLEQQLKNIAQTYDIKLIGPNCLGMIRPSIGMNASFAKDVPKIGGIALLSQSGAIAVALMDSASDLQMGFSSIISIGNKAVMDECDFLELCEADPETKVIGLYLENIKDGQQFLDIAGRITETKPIVLIKAGVSAAGTKAVSSHTGALAGSDAAIEAVCREAHIHRAHSAQEFLDLLRTLSTQPSLPSNRIAIITNAGGPGILATDAAESAGFILPALTKSIDDELKTKLPASASTHNPIDVIGDALADRYEAALKACGADANIDGLCVVLTPQIMTPCLDVAKAITAFHKHTPLMPIVTSFMGGPTVQKAIDHLHSKNIPNFPTPEAAIKALAALRQTEQRKPIAKNEQRVTSNQQPLPSGLLSEEKTKALFTQYKLPIPSQDLATTAEEAVMLAQKIGYPVIAKISSPDILHKTDMGGVRANLESDDDVKKAFAEIMANAKKNMPNAKINGILIQQFLPPGHEFIVGSIKDPSFGHLILAGLGGIYTELFRDTSFRIVPTNETEAYEMLQDLKAWKLLLGMRGKKQSDIDALVQVIVSVSKLISDHPEISELDLNPVLVTESMVTILDAKVIVE